jgi:uncharacterized membrane protein
VGTDRLRIAIGVLGLIGLGIAIYLTYVHYAKIKVACLSSGGCETVQGSVYAKLAGIPVPVLGLVGYAGILASLAVPGDLGRFAGFLLALTGFLFSAYLTYRELFTIKAICQWCVGSAVDMTLLMVITGIRALRTEPLDTGPPVLDAPEPAPAPRPRAARR